MTYPSEGICKTCKAAQKCKKYNKYEECDKKLYLDVGDRVKRCPDGTFPEEEKCEEWGYLCRECTSAENCEDCQKGKFLVIIKERYS